jgi:rubrerythrin
MEENAVKLEAPKTSAPAPKTEKSDSKVEGKAENAVAKARETYERFVQRLTDELKEAGKGGKKQWEDAVKSTRDFLAKAKPPLKREELDKVGETVKKDVRHALRSITARGEGWTSSEAFLTARDKGAQFLLTLARNVKKAALSVETNLEETLRYKKGEIVSGGTFVCAACSQELKVETSGPIPACPKCAKEDFKRKG